MKEKKQMIFGLILILFVILCSCSFYKVIHNSLSRDGECLIKLRESVFIPRKYKYKEIVCDGSVNDLFSKIVQPNCCYIIKNSFAFCKTLKVPEDCELFFDGGNINGPICFDNTYLCGYINIIGSALSGDISNENFCTSWNCYIDGVHDDSRNINEALSVCNNLYISPGTYILKHAHSVSQNIQKNLSKSLDSYIGINRSNMTISGEPGAVLIAEVPKTVLCIYSPPFDIPNQISNIKIQNLTIKCLNNGDSFNEFCHSIKTVGVINCEINNCTFDDFWGDAICLSHYGDSPSTGERTRNIDVHILNNHIKGGDHHNNRNGISIISGQHISIKNNTIVSTSRKDMPGAIDIEANNTAYTIDDISICSNNISKCYGLTGGICLIANTAGGPAHNINIIGNFISSCPNGLGFGIYSDNTVDSIFISKNNIEADTEPYLFDGKGTSSYWVFDNNKFKKKTNRKIGGDMKISNLVFK